MHKLNQIVAIEKSAQARADSDLTKLHHDAQKAQLFSGFAKTYRPKDEEGEKYPSEQLKVQLLAGDVLQRAAERFTEWLDVTATKDYANQHASADVIVNGEILISKVPVSFLLWLEKRLQEIRTFIDKLPVLDEADDWALDTSTGLYKTVPNTAHRTKKTQTPVVAHPATVEHPAQVVIMTEDIVVGYWDTVKHSGAIPAARKKVLLNRVEEVQKAVKVAREAANMTDAPEQRIGKALFDYLLQ